MKLCKDCKHFKDDSIIGMGWCTNPKLDNKDLVYGTQPEPSVASSVRKDYNSCGTTGNWWENITPQPLTPQPKNFWQKLISKWKS